ncbi:MAG: hypothetical protein R3F19_23655 [Verrucomicrobiales bacterium]
MSIKKAIEHVQWLAALKFAALTRAALGLGIEYVTLVQNLSMTLQSVRWLVETEPAIAESSASGRLQPYQKMPKRATKRNLLPQFKFQVALEALKELRSVNEIAASNKVHPSQVTAGRRNCEGGSQLFERKNGKNREFEDQEAHTAELERTLGKIVIEKEFWIKKCKQLGIEP